MVGVHLVHFPIVKKLRNRVGCVRHMVVEHVVNFQNVPKAVSHEACAVATAVGLNAKRMGVRNGFKETGIV